MMVAKVQLPNFVIVSGSGVTIPGPEPLAALQSTAPSAAHGTVSLFQLGHVANLQILVYSPA